MDEVKCELCPIAIECPIYKQAREDNDLSYHPQEVVRAYAHDCSLINLIKKEEQPND